MNFTGIIIGLASFVSIGIFHPIVIKAEYYWTKRCWPCFLVVGIAAVIASLLIDNYVVSTCLGVFAFSGFWSIWELFEQEQRVKKGWFPANPKRKSSKNDPPQS